MINGLVYDFESVKVTLPAGMVIMLENITYPRQAPPVGSTMFRMLAWWPVTAGLTGRLSPDSMAVHFTERDFSGKKGGST